MLNLKSTIAARTMVLYFTFKLVMKNAIKELKRENTLQNARV